MQIQIPMISITSFTKEKTAKIIPNAVAVTTPEDTHTFTSFISREATYKVMTKAWRRALSKHNLANLVRSLLFMLLFVSYLSISLGAPILSKKVEGFLPSHSKVPTLTQS